LKISGEKYLFNSLNIKKYKTPYLSEMWRESKYCYEIITLNAKKNAQINLFICILKQYKCNI